MSVVPLPKSASEKLNDGRTHHIKTVVTLDTGGNVVEARTYVDGWLCEYEPDERGGEP